MVKKSLVLFLVLIFFTNCKRNYIQNDEFLVKKANLSKEIFCNIIDDSLFPQINLDSITVDGLSKLVRRNKLSNEFVKFIEPKASYCQDYDSSEVNYKSLAYYACTKIIFQKGVISYLIIRESEGVFKIFLLNFKNKILKSMVLTSANNVMFPDITYLKTYINYNQKSFFAVNKIHLSGIDAYRGDYDFWSNLGILKPKRLKYYYSTFTIDENGYVKTIPFEKEDFPGYMNY